MGKKRITMTIDDEIFSTFENLCKNKAMKISSKVELMMREFLESQKEEEKDE